MQALVKPLFESLVVVARCLLLAVVPDTEQPAKPDGATAATSAFGDKRDAEAEGDAPPGVGLAQQSPWTVESATGVNSSTQVINKAIEAAMGQPVEVFKQRALDGIALGEKYEPGGIAAEAKPLLLPEPSPWLHTVKAAPPGDQSPRETTRVLVDATSNQIIGVIVFRAKPMDAMVEDVKGIFGKTNQNVDGRELFRFALPTFTLKYTFPTTIARVTCMDHETRIVLLDRNYVESSLRPYANAVVSACRWAKKVAGYEAKANPEGVPNVPLADLHTYRNANNSKALLIDRSLLEEADLRLKRGLNQHCDYNTAAAWNEGNARGATVALLSSQTVGIPKIRSTEADYTPRSLATAGVCADLFHDLASAIIQHEFPPAGRNITVLNARREWIPEETTRGLREAQVDPGAADLNLRFMLVTNKGGKEWSRCYHWTDAKGWSIYVNESLVFTVCTDWPSESW